MNESAKWRSGRDSDRVVWCLPSGRGGKTPREFGGDEGVAGEDYRDVMVPAWPAPSLEVVEAEFAFEVLVGPLGAIALFDCTNECAARDRSGQARQVELCRRLFTVRPFDDEPKGFSLTRLDQRIAVGARDAHGGDLADRSWRVPSRHVQR